MNTHDFLLLLGKSSAQAAVLALLVLLVQRLFRRQLSPGWRAALWLLVLLRLLPFSLGSHTSLFNAVPTWTAEPALNFAEREPVMAPNLNDAPIEPEALQEAIREPVASPKKPALPSAPWTLSEILFGVWAAGCGLLLAGTVLGAWHFSRGLRKCRQVENARLLTLLRECAESLDIAAVPELLECPSIASPAVCGWRRPRILLPTDITASFTEEQLRFIFLHELAHLRRRDIPISWLSSLLLCLHWFNPVIWFVLSRWRSDREEACDALALETAGCERRLEYGNTMLQMLERVSSPRFVPGALGIFESRSQLRRRISLIASHVPRRGWPILAVFLTGGLAAVGLTDAQKGSQPEPTAIPGHTLTITVSDGETGTGIAGAQLNAPFLRQLATSADDWDRSHKTDAQGKVTLEIPRWMLDDPQYANFPVYVTHGDYAPRALRWRAKDKSLAQILPDTISLPLDKGISIGGFVLDAAGAPIAGARVSCDGEYSRMYKQNVDSPQALAFSAISSSRTTSLTDERGHWSMAHFPSDIESYSVLVQEPRGACIRFLNTPFHPRGATPVPVFDVGDARKGTATFVFPKGSPFRGFVSDEAGAAVAGASVQVGNEGCTQTLETNAQGEFEIPNWVARSASLYIQKAGFTDKPLFVKNVGAQERVEIALTKAKPLKLRLCNDKGQALANALVGVDPRYRFSNLEPWRGRTDADGRITWNEAPNEKIVLLIRPADTSTEHTRAVVPANEEIVLQFREGVEKAIRIQLVVTDAEDKKPVEQLRIYRSTNRGGVALDHRAQGGRYTVTMDPKDFSSNYNEFAKILIRAEGYRSWSSENFRFSDGDQSFVVKLEKGSDDAEAPLLTSWLNPPSTDPLILAYCAQIPTLLSTGDIDAFMSATSPNKEDWDAILAKNDITQEDAETNKVQASRERIQDAQRKNVISFLKVSERAGLKGLQLELGKVSSRRFSSRVRYGTTPSCVEIPVNAVVLQLKGKDGAAKLDLELEVQRMECFPSGYRGGFLRWKRLPDNLDSALRAEIGLLNKLGGGIMTNLVENDDPGLTTFAGSLVTWLKTGATDAFLGQTAPADKDRAQLAELFGGASADRMDSDLPSAKSELLKMTQDFQAEAARKRLDLSKAVITVKQIGATRARCIEIDDVKRVRANSLRIVFEARFPSSYPNPKHNGTYVVESGKMIRTMNRWVFAEPKLAITEMPGDAAERADKALDAFGNFLAKTPLPPGSPVGKLALSKLEESGSLALSAFQGKVLVLEFWSYTNEESQESMSALQRLMEDHPTWKDKVVVLSVNVNAFAQKALEHIKAQGWTKTENYWTGEAGLGSDLAKAFRLKHVPTLCVIDGQGLLVTLDTPSALESRLSELVEYTLKRNGEQAGLGSAPAKASRLAPSPRLRVIDGRGVLVPPNTPSALEG